jgi:ABC-2 type transport system permease protein
MRSLRLIGIGWLLHFKQLAKAPFEGAVTALWPIVNATLAYFMYSAGGHAQTLLYASLGSAVAGIWSVTTIAASSAIQNQRWYATLELLVIAPANFALVLVPICLAVSSIGVYSLASTLVWGRLVYGIPLPLTHPLAFAIAIPATIVSLGVLGFLLSTILVRYRTAWALGNSFEYPVWLVCGLMFPIAFLPAWSHPISWALAPTWGLRALLYSSTGGPVWPALGMCALLAAVYLGIGLFLVGRVIDAARRDASLALS